MFKRNIRAYSCNSKSSYAKSEIRKTAIAHSQRLSADNDIYRLTTVHSIDNDRQKCLPDVDMFFENAHMDSVVCVLTEPSQDCKTCTEKIEAMKKFSARCLIEQERTALWNYTETLAGEELERFCASDFYTDDIAAGLDKLMSHMPEGKHMIDELLRQKKEKDKKNIERHSQGDVCDEIRKQNKQTLERERAEYFKKHDNVNNQDFQNFQLSMSSTSMFCELGTLYDCIRTRGDEVRLVFNHYIDDYRYIKLANILRHDTEYNMRLFRDRNICMLSILPVMPYNHSIEQALSLQKKCVVMDNNDDKHNENDTQRFSDFNVRTEYIACSIRNYFGAIHIVIKGQVNSMCEQISQSEFSHLHCVDYNLESYEGIVSSVYDYITFIRQASRRIFSGFLCTRDICTAMLYADMTRGKDISPLSRHIHSKHNKDLKKESYICLIKTLNYCGLVIDFNRNMSLGYSDPCNDHSGIVQNYRHMSLNGHFCDNYSCTCLRHKHVTVLYVDLTSKHFVSHMTQFLSHANYLTNLCNTTSTHMRRIILGEAKFTITQRDIMKYEDSTLFTTLYDKIKHRLHTQHIEPDVSFDMSYDEYITMIRDIRFRQYTFTQIHDIQRHSFNDFLRLHCLVNKIRHNIDPIYLFHIGDISIRIPLYNSHDDTLDYVQALQNVNKHMIKLSESNFRRSTHTGHTLSQSICADTLTYYTQQEKDKYQLNGSEKVPLKLLSGKFRISHSSIGAAFSIENHNTLRVYMSQDVQLPHMHDNAEYVYYGTHSFSVTITGAFTKVLDHLGRHIEKIRCDCQDNENMCQNCLHNIVFCNEDSHARQYIDMMFEKLMPYIATICSTYSFNNASTKGCEVDRMLFNDRMDTIACGHSVEFLFCKNVTSMTRFRENIDDSNNVRLDVMEEIVNDEDFCVVLIEPISETYGPIKTNTVELFNKVLHLYYNHMDRQSIHVMSPGQNRMMLMESYMHMLCQVEDIHEHKKDNSDPHKTHTAQCSREVCDDNSGIYFNDSDLQKYDTHTYDGMLLYTAHCETCADTTQA